MKNKVTKKILKISILILTFIVGSFTTGCGLMLRPAFSRIKTGPVQEKNIIIPLPEDPSSNAVVNLEFTAGTLNISPGALDSLVSGKATFNAEEYKPVLIESGNVFFLRQGDQETDAIPLGKEEVINFWDLRIGNTPVKLNIQAGAYTGRMELGGLSIRNLTINEGGSDFFGSFSEPNRVEMNSFDFKSGGSHMVLRGLANANFAEMNLIAGAGDYTLSFDGELKRDAQISIEAGAGTISIIVPRGMNAVVIFSGDLTTINNDGWSQDETVYKLTGSGPTITFLVDIGMGTLNLKTE